MAKKIPTLQTESPELKASRALDEWDGETVVVAVPSGIPIQLEPDEEGLFRFIGVKDITDKVAPKEGDVPDKKVIYLTFCDGRNIVAFPNSYKLAEVKEWTPNGYYYIVNEGELEMGPGRNPMKDYSARFLGLGGKKIKVPARIQATPLVLGDAQIAALNYKSLNYPLRKV